MVAGSQQVDNVTIKLLDRPRREIRQRCQLVHFLSAGELAQTILAPFLWRVCSLAHAHKHNPNTNMCPAGASVHVLSHVSMCGRIRARPSLNTFKLDRDKPIYKDPGEKQ